MKRRTLLAWLVFAAVLTSSRLAAQDVTVTDPAWFDPENAPADQLPTFKKRPKPDFPDELLKPEQVAYAIVVETLDEKGKRMSSRPFFSSPYLEKIATQSAAVNKIEYTLAARGSKAIRMNFWFGIIFNPRSASLKAEDSAPRLLTAAPVIVNDQNVSKGTKIPLVIWATVSLDEKGSLKDFTFDEPAHEIFRKQVSSSLRFWRFDSARRSGQAVAAELHVPFVFVKPAEPRGLDKQPKPIYREPPVYPYEMRTSAMRGEVLLEFIVDQNGVVTNPVAIRSNNPGFNDAAIDALLKWKFEPGRIGGEPVKARMQQPFIFEIQNMRLGEPMNGRDFAAVDQRTNRDQQKLPPQLQYDVAPRPTGVLEPVYPYAFLRDRVEGHASVAFLVNDEGKVSQLKVIAASHPEFGLAMAAAVEAFEFVPALKNGKPTNSVLKIEQKFDRATFEKIISEEEIKLLTIEKKHPEKILSAKKLDTPLNPISFRGPVFPSVALGRFERGEAKIEVLIDEEGKVRLPRIVTATEPAFGYAAIQAVMAWRFAPPKVGGKPTVVRVQVPFTFNLEIESTKLPEPPVTEQSPAGSATEHEKQ